MGEYYLIVYAYREADHLREISEIESEPFVKQRIAE